MIDELRVRLRVVIEDRTDLSGYLVIAQDEGKDTSVLVSQLDVMDQKIDYLKALIERLEENQ